MPYHDLIRGAPHLFYDQFDSAMWLFLPIAQGNPWIGADLKNIKIYLSNSLAHETDSVYQDMHRMKILLNWLVH